MSASIYILVPDPEVFWETGSLRKGRVGEPWLVAFSYFCGISTPAMGYFDLSTWRHWCSCTTTPPEQATLLAKPADILGWTGLRCTILLASLLILFFLLPFFPSFSPLKSNITSPYRRTIILQLYYMNLTLGFNNSHWLSKYFSFSRGLVFYLSYFSMYRL